ncbi:lipopolysaccharide biosynthesis protein [Sphingosinicella microcystinivorans]|uniref:Lipopolysaccharide biosynthesis protein n=1 Tax=Sphingosinicella microcystinivorans TaxID=335406 RepID=A0AAD1D6I9_SPHMI|nr:lipopolysaccharide biosynthesis protein [Sphingosinicella microcystinivorans]RKS91823.1 PST family polysaccharide transporter [Sphingosinicella microcystinivorans]BBE34807.1 lipopolysaccharide biosynthesis protein [Sphingosinicella microcystinivorans]
MKFERSEENIGNRVFKGALFLAGARFVLRLFSMVNLVVLGRLLAPADYGVASLAIVVIGFVQVLSDMRVNSALIALRDIDTHHIDTGFTMNFLRGALIAAILFIFAGPIANYMNEPKLEDVLRVICVVLIFDGARNPAFMMYQRNIDFSKEFNRRVASTIFGSLAAIVVAVATESYWAIVAGTLAGRFTEMVLSYWRIPYQPRVSFREWRTFLGFGGWLTMSGIISHFTQIAPQFLIGKYMGAAQLGYFTIGRDVSQVATRELATPISQAITPGLSAIAHNNTRLRGAYRKAQSVILGIALPIGVGTALMANEMIAILVGTKWLPSSEVVVLLAPTLAFTMITSATDGLAMAKQATRAMFNRAVLVAAISLPVFALAVWQGTFITVIYALVFRLLLQTAVNMYFAKTLIGDSFFSPFTASWRSLLAAAAMAGAVLAVPAPFAPGDAEYVVLLEMMPRVILGAAVYVLAHFVLWRLAGRPDGFETKMLEVSGIALGKLRRFRRTAN